MRVFRWALEEMATGRVVEEVEHVIYAELIDFTQLSKADSKEEHEQWEIKIPKTPENGGSGSLRVRETVVDGKAQYVITTKINKNSKGDKIEVSVPTTKENFVQFKFMANKGMIKDRYTFLVPGTDLKWEVDCFKQPDGKYYPWVKIDLEVTNRNDPLPQLPMHFRDVIMPKGFGRADEAESEAKIKELYERYFLTPNTFVKK